MTEISAVQKLKDLSELHAVSVHLMMTRADNWWIKISYGENYSDNYVSIQRKGKSFEEAVDAASEAFSRAMKRGFGTVIELVAGEEATEVSNQCLREAINHLDSQ